MFIRKAGGIIKFNSKRGGGYFLIFFQTQAAKQHPGFEDPRTIAVGGGGAVCRMYEATSRTA